MFSARAEGWILPIRLIKSRIANMETASRAPMAPLVIAPKRIASFKPQRVVAGEHRDFRQSEGLALRA
jgi:hypothetical protein